MNDIIVPAERLAELLKAEYTAQILSVADETFPYEVEYRRFSKKIDLMLENGTLAAEFGFEENGDSEVNVVIDDAGDNACVGE